MTTSLIFLAGVGVGCVAAMILLCACVLMATRKPHKETSKQNEITASLMRERNELDLQKIEQLKRIGNLLQNLK